MPAPKVFLPFLSAFGGAARRMVALVLVLAIGPAAPLFGQAAAAPMMLHITILDGEDALNNIRERTAREPIVQVEDENHKPVAGALLLFSIQSGPSGAGGTFNGLTSFTATADAQGRAIAHGLTPNATAGSYSISVTATYGSLVATTVIHQINALGGGAAAPEPPAATPPAPVAEVPAPAASGGSSTLSSVIRQGLRHIPKKVWITGATIVTTGVVVGVVVATHGNNPTTITPGTGTVGP